ncbi:MAG: PEP-CTERM sorting domain-containing protein, partial [Phycisphaerae bacterium]
DGCGKPSSIRLMDSSHSSNMERKESFMFSSRLSIVRGCSLAAVAAAAVAILAGGNAQAAIIQNGDFSANAAAYINFPGYDGGAAVSPNVTPNPTAPTNWTQNGTGGVGINGVDTTTGNPFGPSAQQATPTLDWVFLQNAGAAVFQSYTVTAGQSYQVSYLDANRATDAGYAHAYVLGGSLAGPVLGQYQTTPGDVNFQAESFTYTADANTTDFLVLQNASGAGDLTVDFTAVSVAAVPEPATLGLVAVGGLGLLLLKRRRAV